MSYATRETVVTCLRVGAFHNAAGKKLYHTVRVDERNIDGFFLGAFIGNISDTLRCVGANCTHSTDKTVVDTTNVKSSQVKTGPPQNKQTTRSTNFKAPLLLHVRVLSLGSHLNCACPMYGKHSAALLANIDTLRIVSAPKSPFQLKPLCDGPRGCLFFEHLTPRKVVLRNLDNTGWGQSSWSFRWNRNRLKEIVWVLPMEDRVYRPRMLRDASFPVPSTVEVKFIFNDWEVWHASAAVQTSPHEPLTPYQVVGPMSFWTISTVIYTLYGLETLQFQTGTDPLVILFKHHFSPAQMDTHSLRELVKNELRDGTVRKVGRVGGPEDHDLFHRNIVYKTLVEYAALPEWERQYELDDGLMARFPQ